MDSLAGLIEVQHLDGELLTLDGFRELAVALGLTPSPPYRARRFSQTL